jgi:hypothetical protein
MTPAWDDNSVADSDALRSRRRRRHARGQHDLCRPGCAARQLAAVPAGPPETGAESPAITDPAAGLRALAGRLEEAHKASPGDAPLGRVLKDVWVALASLEGAGGGELAGLLDELSS